MRHEVPAGNWTLPPPPESADPALWLVVPGVRGPVVLRRRETVASARRWVNGQRAEQFNYAIRPRLVRSEDDD